MCKSSCCPDPGQGGHGLAAVAIITVVAVAALARPAAHAALAVAHAAITITVITVAALAGVAVPAAVALAVRRACRARTFRPPAVVSVRAGVPAGARPPLALPPSPLARCQQPDPELVAQIVTAVLRGRDD